MDESEIIKHENLIRYHLDPEYLESKGRSYISLLQNRLCPSCRKKSGLSNKSREELTNLIADCCSGKAGFFQTNLPIMETILRVFLFNGNRPLTIEELAQEVNIKRSDFGGTVKPEPLKRLLEGDAFYGITSVLTPLDSSTKQ